MPINHHHNSHLEHQLPNKLLKILSKYKLRRIKLHSNLLRIQSKDRLVFIRPNRKSRIQILQSPWLLGSHLVRILLNLNSSRLLFNHSLFRITNNRHLLNFSKTKIFKHHQSKTTNNLKVFRCHNNSKLSSQLNFHRHRLLHQFSPKFNHNFHRFRISNRLLLLAKIK